MDGVCGLQILIVGGIGLQIRCNGKDSTIRDFFLAIHFSWEPLSTCFDLPNASWRRGAAGAVS